MPLRLVGLAVVVELAGCAVFGDSADEVVEDGGLIWGWLLRLDWGWSWRLRNVLGWSLNYGPFGWFSALWVVDIEDKLIKLRRMLTCKARSFFETQILHGVFILPDLILHLFADLLLLLIFLRTILHILQLNYISPFFTCISSDHLREMRSLPFVLDVLVFFDLFMAILYPLPEMFLAIRWNVSLAIIKPKILLWKYLMLYRSRIIPIVLAQLQW